MAAESLGKALSNYHTRFADALLNFEASTLERQWFADIVISRLLLIYDLQVAGFLGQGDRWYLHSHLGRLSQTQADTFFKHFLQPLCHQGLGLPEHERPPKLQKILGQVPYLGNHPFQPHELERAYPTLDLPDEPIEQFLGWLAEQAWVRDSTSAAATDMTREALAIAYEYVLTERSGKPTISSTQTLKAISCAPVEDYILCQLSPHLSAIPDSLEMVLDSLGDRTCQLLVNTILPNITILDPVCGSGRFLRGALQPLQRIYKHCWHYAQTSDDAALKQWLQSYKGASSPIWPITNQLLTRNLFGIDPRPEATTITQLHLWLALLETAQQKQDLAPLPDLDFTITQGNPLVGFIHVDAESFDKVRPRRSIPNTATETVLQGNLLQPLAAAHYRDILAEKKIRVEHYRSQTEAMGLEGGVPDYVQTAFLRDRIDEVNQAVQQKLNRLLFETFSQKLGIKAQDLHPSGRKRKRLLTLEDIQALQPFHWGFFFNEVVEQQGGFSLVLTHYPEGTLRPHADEFYTAYRDQFQTCSVGRAAFKRSRRTILKQYPDLNCLWQNYAAQIACIKDYIRRSDDYQDLTGPAINRSISLSMLYAQRCKLLEKGGTKTL